VAIDLVRYADAAAFAAVALPLYAADPARHTITLTMLDGLLRAGEPPALAITLHEDDALVGAVVRREDRGILVSGLPPRYATTIAEALAGTELPGVVGPVAEAEAFAAVWTASVCHRFDQRLFALGTLTPPVGVPGAARPAAPGDVDLLGAWRAAFTAETGVGQTGSAPSRAATVVVGAGEWVWEVDGVPVAQATARPVVAGMSRVGPVYTLPERRGHGYGAAVTAAASRWALEVGADPHPLGHEDRRRAARVRCRDHGAAPRRACGVEDRERHAPGGCGHLPPPRQPPHPRHAAA
jgi:GNAT superfamily N-acetyltransferase